MASFKEKFLKSINEIKTSIKSFEYRLDALINPNSFIRQRKMDLQDLITFTLNFNKRSIQLELDDFYERVKGNDEVLISKQAFSKRRQAVSPKAFTQLHEITVRNAYSDDEFKTFKGFRLLAIDGSTMALYNTPKMRENFGYIKNMYKETAMAQASVLYDVENELIIHAILDRYEIDEENMVAEHLKKLSEYGIKNDLILFDRGYPSTKLISKLTDLKLSYVMRVPRNFLKEVVRFNGEDGIVEIVDKVKSRKLKVRVINVQLEIRNRAGKVVNTMSETLITNVLKTSFTSEDFKELYAKRWGIETNYDVLKNKLEIENFTGTTPITIQQDFHATVLLLNLASMVKASATEELQEKNQGKGLKYQYKANTNLVIGKLREKLIMMVLEPDPEKQSKILDNIVERLTRNAIPIRPGRILERNKTKIRFKYSTNRKRCL